MAPPPSILEWFTPADHKNFFQKFQRGENVKDTEVHTSSGLGLYIARQFVEGHKGQVWGQSQGLGQGSEFGFWVPLAQGKA